MKCFLTDDLSYINKFFLTLSTIIFLGLFTIGVSYFEESLVTSHTAHIIWAFFSTTSLVILVFYVVYLKRSERYSYVKQLEQETKEKTEELIKKEKMFMEQSRLAQMGEMISMIAHQWRQPLGAIAAIMATIKVKAELTEEVSIEELTGQLDHANSLIQHLSKTVDDFKDFFKPSNKRIPISLDELVTETLEIVRVPLSNNNNIEVKCEFNSKHRVEVFGNELKQVLLSIINNASDVMPDGGVIDITTETLEEKVVVKISDSGGGIPEYDLKHIFDPYFSTKGKNGTGLGLYMCKTIVEDHCLGVLTAYNKDKGAVFEMTFPRCIHCENCPEASTCKESTYIVETN